MRGYVSVEIPVSLVAEFVPEVIGRRFSSRLHDRLV
jgi:hypothetical protein